MTHQKELSPLRIQLEATINPDVPVAQVINALATVEYGLRKGSVLLTCIQIETRGLGEGYLAALQGRRDMPAGVALKSFKPAR